MCRRCPAARAPDASQRHKSRQTLKCGGAARRRSGATPSPKGLPAANDLRSVIDRHPSAKRREIAGRGQQNVSISVLMHRSDTAASSSPGYSLAGVNCARFAQCKARRPQATKSPTQAMAVVLLSQLRKKHSRQHALDRLSRWARLRDSHRPPFTTSAAHRVLPMPIQIGRLSFAPLEQLAGSACQSLPRSPHTHLPPT